MPHTHPSPLCAMPHEGQHMHPHLTRSHLLSPHSSRYLSPVQEQRILSWRSDTSHSGEAPEEPSKHKTKSAPASLNLSSVPSGQASSGSPCAACAVKSQCSCSTKSPKSSRQRSYYAKKKKSATTTQSGMTPMTPMTGTVDKRGMPSPAQIAAYHMGSAPFGQFGNAPVVPVPDPAVAMPPIKPDLPRIAGARDPVSQNYWRQMFPPANVPGIPFGQQGPFPPHMNPMQMGRPWGC